MEQRGVSRSEIERTLNEGWDAGDAKPGTEGRTYVFPFHDEWEGTRYDEKEVTVYFKRSEDDIILLTVIARYGNDFPRGEGE